MHLYRDCKSIQKCSKMGLECQYKTVLFIGSQVFRRQLSRSLLFLSLYLVYRFSWLGYLLNFFCDILLILFTVFDLFRICYTVYYFFQGCSRISYNFFIHCFFPEIFSQICFYWLGFHVQFFCLFFLGIYSCFCAAGSPYCVHIHLL